MPDDHSANLSRAWQAAPPAGGTLGATVGGALGAVVGIAVGAVVGGAVGAADGGGDPSADGTGAEAAGATVGAVVAADVTIGDGAPTPADAARLAGGCVTGAVTAVPAHAVIRTIPARIHRRRTPSRLDDPVPGDVSG